MHDADESRFTQAVLALEYLLQPLRAAPVNADAASQRGPLLEVASDLSAFSDILLEVHNGAVAFETGQLSQLLAPEPSPRDIRTVRRLHASYRAFFFLTRELQDHAYGVLIATCKGGKVGPEPSMKAAKNVSNPVRLLLDQHTPGYWDWFSRWRSLRNELKDGRSVLLAGPVAHLGITFQVTKQPSHQGKHEVRLADATETIKHSTAVIRLATDRLHATFRDNAAPAKE